MLGLGTEWIWELKDMATQPLGVIFGSIGRVDAAALAAEQHIGAIGVNDYGFDNLNLNLGTTKKKTDEAGEGVFKLSSLFKTAAVAAASFFAVQGFGQLTSEVYRAGTAMEQTEIAFGTLLQDADLAQVKIKELQQFADVSPFNTSEVFDAGVALTGFGIAADGLLPIMNTLGDASMGNANKFKSLVDNYGKLVSAQRVTTMDLNQFALQGVPIWNELGKVVGKSGGALRDEVEGGKITVEQVNQALENMTKEGGQFFGMMEQQANSTEGRMSTLLSKVEALQVKIFNGFKPLTHSLIDLGTSVLPIIENSLKFIVDNADIIEAIGVAAGVAAGGWVILNAEMLIGQGVAMGVLGVIRLLEVAQWAWNAAMNANPAVKLVTVLALVAGGMYWAFQNVEWFREGMYGLWEVVKVIGNAFVGLGEVIWGALTFDAAMFSRGVATLDNVGYDAGLAWAEGLRKGKLDGDKQGEKAESEFFMPDSPQAGSASSFSNKSVVTAQNTSTSGGKETTMKGDSGGKIINVRIENLGKQITINSANVREGAQEMRRIVQEELVNAVRDFELGISNG